MFKELKAAIIQWLIENETAWQRTNACHEAFHAYIYDENGNYLIGGQIVSGFINKAERLLYGDGENR